METSVIAPPAGPGPPVAPKKRKPDVPRSNAPTPSRHCIVAGTSASHPRRWLVRRVRSEIERGCYETEVRLEIALDRLAAELRG